MADEVLIGAGTTSAQFKRDITNVMNQLLSVAVNPGGQETRTALSARIETDSGSGYLIAVRMDEKAEAWALHLANELHEVICEVNRLEEDQSNA